MVSLMPTCWHVPATHSPRVPADSLSVIIAYANPRNVISKSSEHLLTPITQGCVLSYCEFTLL